MNLADYYTSFIDAVCGGVTGRFGAFAVSPEGLRGVRIHRNNWIRAMSAALASNYPAVFRLIGESCFETAAAAFVRIAPPRARCLVGYGLEFPEFLECAAGESSTPYIADVARLDRAWLEAHIAPDDAALQPGDIAQLDSSSLAKHSVRLHPSASLLQTTWRVHDVWKANRLDDAGANVPRAVWRERQSILIWRSSGEIRDRLLTPAEAVFFGALAGGETLGSAAEAAIRAAQDGDVSVMFAAALASNAFER